jgi:5-formyltetrahydrofolate cyclo-ligase
VSDETKRGLPWDDAQILALRPRAKAVLRKRYRGLRASHPASARLARSEAICRAVMALPGWLNARTIAVFYSMDEEVDLSLLVADARARGCTVVLPAVTDDETLEFRVGWRGEETFPRSMSAWGIEEPDAGAPVVAHESLEWIVVPCLAVDATGQRLGYGRGYYDRALPRCTNATSVAVAFDFQLLAEIPHETHDVAVSWVVTDRQTLRVLQEERSASEKC